jgi:hypothetical protein
MPELRQDPLSDEWIIMANDQGKRPEDFKRTRPPEPKAQFLATCPFCPGNEDQTPSELDALRYPNASKARRPSRYPVPYRFLSPIQGSRALRFFAGKEIRFSPHIVTRPGTPIRKRPRGEESPSAGQRAAERARRTPRSSDGQHGLAREEWCSCGIDFEDCGTETG